MTTTSPHDVTRNLPPEIFLAVSTCCSRSELCTLVLLNHNFYNALIHEIYTNITLLSRRMVENFSDTLANGGSHLKDLPRSIYIHPKQLTTKLLFRLANSIRQALSQTTKLLDLTLFLQYKAVKAIFRDIAYPFLLTRLACPAISGKDFSRFLQTQISLEEFVVLRSVRGGLTVGTVIRHPAPGSLPKLASISAEYETLAALIPGRPITNVSTGPATLNPSEYEGFATSVSKSTAHVHTVDISLSYLWMNSALSNPTGLLAALAGYSVRPKHLMINLVLPEPLSTSKPNIWQHHASDILDNFYPSILHTLEHLDLSAFHGLQEFEIIQRQGLTVWIKREEPFLLENGLCTQLKNSCPSLKRVRLFGLLLQ